MLGNIPNIPSTLECLASKGLSLLQRQKYTPASEDGVAALKVGSVHSRTGVITGRNLLQTAYEETDMSASPRRRWSASHCRVVRELPYDFCAASGALARRVT